MGPQQPLGLSPYLPLKETEAKFIFNPSQMYLYLTRICLLLCLMPRNKSLMVRLAMSTRRSFLTCYVGRGGTEEGSTVSKQGFLPFPGVMWGLKTY